MTTKPLLLILIDGHALVHRAYHALGPASGRSGVAMTTKSGEPVTAVYGFASMLIKVLNEYQPTHVICAFDTHAPTFRDALYTEYKAGRAAMPDDLRPQFDRVRDLLAAFNIPTYEMDGFEADDILGTISLQASEQNIETIIVTGDADTMQLIGPQVRVLYPGSRSLTDATLYDPEKVYERYGVPPERVPDWKGLKGDPSDNIPGVPGVGDKTATKLLQEHDTVERIYEHLDQVTPPRMQELLRSNEELARKSKHLATIVRDVPVTLDLEACHIKGYQRAKVVTMLRDLEFNSLLSRLPAQSEGAAPGEQLSFHTDDTEVGSEIAAPSSKAAPDGVYTVVDTPEALDIVIARLAAAERIVVDVETTSLQPTEAELVGIALSPGPNEAYYLPTGHKLGQNLPMELVRERLGPLLSDPNKPKVAHNGNYDMIVLEEHGLHVEPLGSDTILAAWLLGEKSLGLKALAFSKLGIEMTQISSLIGTGAKQVTMDVVPVEQAAPYAAADADMTARLRAAFEPALEKEGLWDLYTNVEIPLVPVLVQMERWGVALDTGVLAAMSRDLGAKMGELESAIYGSVGHHFNINSTQQLGQVLFDDLGLPHGRRTKSGYSTDQSVLDGLRGAHPIVEHILEYRQLTKLKSTYIDALPALVNPTPSGCIPASTRRALPPAASPAMIPTCRTSPYAPSLAARCALPLWRRRAATSCLRTTHRWSCECWRTSPVTRGSSDAFMADEDIHNATASTVFGVAPEEVTSDHRRIAKVVNFGIVYGLSSFGLSQAIPGMSRAEADTFIQTYFDRYPGIQGYIKKTLKEGQEKGYVETLLGRRRYMPELLNANAQVRQAAERVAINMPVQGTAADVIKVAMIKLHKVMQDRELRSKMILQVHDELLFEVPEAELQEMERLVPEMMSTALELIVPVKVEVKVGANWGVLREVEEGAEELLAVQV